MPEPSECNYTTGVHYWKAGVGGNHEDECYKSVNTSENYIITIKSNLNPNITYPNGEGFMRGNPIPIYGWLEDDCGPVPDASVFYVISKPPNAYNRSNTAQFNDSGQWQEGNGWYNYTWLDTNRPTGWYSLEFYASKEFYGPNRTNKSNALFITLPPTLSYPSIDPNYGGWGETYRFSVKVSDNDLNYNNVTLWKRQWNEAAGSWDNWTLLNWTYKDQLTGVWIDFYHNFSCSDMGLNQFRFITVDEFNYSDDTNNYLTNVSKLIHNASDGIATNVSKLIHNASVGDDGFDYSEQITVSGEVDYFNITIQNQNGSTIYFNLTVNGVVVAENQSLDDGYNFTVNAKENVNIPGYQDINLTIMNDTGGISNASYFAWLDYAVLDQGFNYSEYISTSGDIEYFNITISNLDNKTLYFNLTVNQVLVAENWSVTNGTNITINAMAEGADFDLPGDQNIILTLMNESGSVINGKYMAYLDYVAGILTFRLEADNVTVEISTTSNSTARRMGSQTAFLNFTIYDTDLGTYAPWTSGKIWITEDGVNYTVEMNCTSTTEGYCTVNYNPSCNSYVGVQQWKGGTNDVCYDPENTTDRDLTVIGQLYVSTLNPKQNDILNRNTSEILNATVTDECNVSISDATVSWYNSSWVLLNTTTGVSPYYYNTTWLVPYNYTKGPETLYINTTRQYFDMGSNETSIYIYGWSQVSIHPPNGSEYSAGTDIPVICHVEDANTGESIQGYNVSFYKDGIWQQSSDTNEFGNTTWYWNTSEESPQNYTISCEINNDASKYYNTSLPVVESIVSIRRQLIIDEINVDNSIIYRNDSYSPYETTIEVHVRDANVGPAEGANVSFYNSTGLFDYCETDSSGYCNITYNPENTTIPGNYNISINATKPGVEDSDTSVITLEIRGVLILNITSPLNESEHNKNETIDLLVDIKNEMGQDITGAFVKWYNETSLIAAMENVYDFPLSTQEAGNRTFVVNATKTYYATGEDSVMIVLSGIVNIEFSYPQNFTEMPYPDSFDVICRVVDSESGVGIDDYEIRLYYYYSPPFIFIGNFTTNSTGYINYTFTPFQKGNVTFKCNITSNISRLMSAGISNTVSTVIVKDVTPPVITNTSIVPNQSMEANLNYTNITANVTDDVGVNHVWAYIGLPNGSYDNATMTLLPGENDTYRVQYLPPIGGKYNVTVYAMDDPWENNVNSLFVGYFYVWGNITGTLSQTDEIMATGITQTQGYPFSITLNFTNLGPPNAYSVNLTVLDSPSDSLDFDETFHECGTLAANQTCSWTLNVTVPEATPPILIVIHGYANWTDPDKTFNSTSNLTYVYVASNPVLEIIESSIPVSYTHLTLPTKA